MPDWFDKWRIKINQSKPVHITFTPKQSLCPNITLDNVLIPTSITVGYLGLDLDKRLAWNHSLRTKILALVMFACGCSARFQAEIIALVLKPNSKFIKRSLINPYGPRSQNILIIN